MITHKPEIARRSDKIFVLEDKQILIQGTHGELMQQKIHIVNITQCLLTK